MIVGDFLANVRSSLDYLIWELALAAKNNPTDKNMFPICTTLGRRLTDNLPDTGLTGFPLMRSRRFRLYSRIMTGKMLRNTFSPCSMPYVTLISTGGY